MDTALWYNRHLKGSNNEPIRGGERSEKNEYDMENRG